MWRVMCVIGMLAGAMALGVTIKGGNVALEVGDTGRVSHVTVGTTAPTIVGQGGFAVADFAHQPETANLVPNGGFEEGTAGWRLGAGQSLDTAVAHGGKASARLEVPGPEPGKNNLEVVVPVRPNTRYRVGMWLRRQGVGVCGVYSSERDEAGKLTGKQGQVGTTIPKQDGVWLPLSWEIVTEPATTRLSLRGDIYNSTGTLWLDDFFVEEMSEGTYLPVSGTVTAAEGGAKFAGKLAEQGLELTATLKGDKDCVRVDGVVSDLTGRDRAVGVRFALPVDLTGWTWFDDAEERGEIKAGTTYRRTYACKSGIGLCSVYPWSAVAGPEAGLSVALPLSQGPRVFLLQYGASGSGFGTNPPTRREGELSVTFFFGLAKDAGQNPSRAPFSFVIYPHDQRYGMRSAMETYYRLFPESFVKRPTFEGYLNYANLERFDPKTHDLVVANRPLSFTVENRLAQAAEVTPKLTAPAKTTLEPAEVALTLPARGKVAQVVKMTLEPTARLGEARIGWATTAGDERFNQQGTVELVVSDPVPQLAIKRVAAAPVVDGKLEEWTGEPLIPELHILSNGDPASEKTAVWTAYDDKGLYVAFRCQESQLDKLVAKYTERGAPLYLDDDVEMFIFVPGRSRVYQFAVNPNGAQSDNFGNKAEWVAAAQRGEGEWTLEAFIPFAAVGQTGPPARELPWGMQYGRQQKAKQETTSWTKGPAFINKEGFGEIVFE